jgi:serine phosphatase RsbU (regulator of sigma subunit)
VRASPVPGAKREDPSESSAGPIARARGIRATPATLIVLAIGFAVTAALALTTLALYNSNENRLLRVRARELNVVIAETVPSVQTPLASAAALADATGGSAHSFRTFISTYVGPKRQFISASLWKIEGARLVRVATVGAPSQLQSRPQALAQFLSRARRPGVLQLTGMLEGAHPALGFQFSTSQRAPVFTVYAENALPASRRSKIERNSAFSDLDYVLYLGSSRSQSQLLVTNVSKLPLHGRQATDVVPYGAGHFTLVVAPKGSLSGAFFRDLPWIVGLVGALLSLAAAFAARRLALGRERAHQLAQDLDRIAAGARERYWEQRSISQTLQHALLPAKLPKRAGLQVSAVYVPASSGLDVGGDWYDVVELGAGRLLLIIGDVSGHGLEAATTMALLRHAALAYAAQDASPAGVLENLARFARTRDEESCFATVLCAQFSLDDGQVRVASAGHLAPLLLDGARAHFLDLDIDPAIGLRRVRPRYRESVSALPAAGTLIAFTDGLVERRGEVIDAGLMRLSSLASSKRESLDELVVSLAHELTFGERRDDTAVVGVHWER